MFVQGGGCSGFQYGFTFDEIVNEDDTTMTKNGVQLLIDSMSYQYLVGAEIDYKDDLEGAQFVIKNPNATTTCGCGSSFSAYDPAGSNRPEQDTVRQRCDCPGVYVVLTAEPVSSAGIAPKMRSPRAPSHATAGCRQALGRSAAPARRTPLPRHGWRHASASVVMTGTRYSAVLQRLLPAAYQYLRL